MQETNTKEIFTGEVTYFEEKIYCGMITETESQREYFFRQPNQPIVRWNKQLQIPNRGFRVGEKITFQLMPSTERPGELQAYNLKLIVPNPDVAAFLEAIKVPESQGKTRRGELNKTTELQYIIDAEFHVLLPIKIVPWEIEIEEHYHQRLGQIVDYQIINVRQIPKNLEAQLVERKFNDDYRIIEALMQQPEGTTVRVTARQKDNKGYFVSIKGVEKVGFLLLSPQKMTENVFDRGQKITVIVKGMGEKHVHLTLPFSNKAEMAEPQALDILPDVPIAPSSNPTKKGLDWDDLEWA
jgi:ribosomal protein S1